MANYSKLLSLISGRSQTIDFSSVSNILELGGGGLQMDGSTSGHVVISASATTSTYSIVWPTAQAASSGYVLSNDGTGVLSWVPSAGGSVTAVSVSSANGFAGSSSGGSTPALTLSTTVTGILYGNGTSVAAAVAGNFPTLNQNTTGTAANITATSNSTLVTLSALTTAGSLAISGSQVSGGTFGAVNGSALTNLSAAALSGVLPVGVTGGSGLSIATSQLTGSISLTSQVSGILPYANGGTNASSQAAAQANMSPMTTAGDLTYENSTPAPARLAIGTNGQVLTVVSGLPAWASATSGTVTSVSVVSANGFTGSVATATTTPAITLTGTLSGDITGTLTSTAITATSNSTLATLSALSLPTSQLSGTISAAQMLPLANNDIYVGNSSNQPVAVAMSGDASIVASGALTLATVNPDVGSFGSSTSIPSFTVNGKGLITAASGNAVVAPAGTLSGSTLNSSVTASSLTSLGIQASALNMGSNQINNVANGSASGDAVNYGQLQAAISGLYWQGPAKAYAASNVPLTGSTPLVIDSYTVLNGDLLILGNQTTASQNGEYSVAISGGSYVLTANGLPSAAGDAWLILNGTMYGDSAFVANAAVPAATFTEFAGPTAYTFSAPLSLSGRTVSITQANTSTDGYLSSTDWNTFNNKQSAGNYITALTGDGTASGPGSSAFTLATVNSNVGTFASVTVNGKGLVTAAAALSGDITTSGSVSTLATVNSNVGTYANATVTVNAKGLVTAASAASTTGTGATVLAGSPTLTGSVSAANVLISGVLVAPTIQIDAVYGGATTMAANTTYALRWGVPANGETAGEVYLADWNTASYDLFWAVGLYNSSSSTLTGANISIVAKGSITLGSSDTTFGASDQGKPVWLGSAGSFSPNSTFAPSSGNANEKLGIAQTASIIYVDFQMMGVS